MGIAASKLVWAKSKSKGATRLVVLCLAEHANDNGVCWPSISTIARETKVSDRQVTRAIQELVNLKEVAIIEKGDGRGKSTIYTITLKDDMVSSFEPQEAQEKGDIPSQKDDICDIKGDILSEKGDTMSPEPSYNHQEPLTEPSKGDTPLPPKKSKRTKKTAEPITFSLLPVIDTPQVRQLLADFEANRREMKKPMTQRAADLLVKRLAGVGECEAVERLQNAISSGWQGVFFAGDEFKYRQGGYKNGRHKTKEEPTEAMKLESNGRGW